MDKYVNGLAEVDFRTEEVAQKGIDTAIEAGFNWAKDQLGLTPKTTTTPTPTPAPVPTTTVPTATPVAMPTQAETGGGIISTVKQIPPVIFGAAAGLLTGLLSKKWLLGLGVGAGTWLLTDKMKK